MNLWMSTNLFVRIIKKCIVYFTDWCKFHRILWQINKMLLFFRFLHVETDVPVINLNLY